MAMIISLALVRLLRLNFGHQPHPTFRRAFTLIDTACSALPLPVTFALLVLPAGVIAASLSYLLSGISALGSTFAFGVLTLLCCFF